MLEALRSPTNPGPSVTVAIAFFNEERFLTTAVDCVRAQTEASWELLLVDDGSTDRSTVMADAMAAAEPDRIHVLRHPGGVNRGLAASRNLAIDRASGEFLCFLDADDLWVPEKLTRQLELFRTHPRAVMVCGPSLHEPSGGSTAPNAVPVRFDAPRLLRRGQFARMRMRGTVTTPPPSDPMFRSSVLRRAGGVPAGPIFAEDQRLFVTVSLQGPIYVDDRVLTTYVVRADSISGARRTDGLEQVRIHREFEQWVVRFCRGAGPQGWTVIAALLYRRLIRGSTRRLRSLRPHESPSG